MTELQTKLQELRELVEAKTVECQLCYGAKGFVSTTAFDLSMPTAPGWIVCQRCNGKGYVSDPTYAPLLEVVRKRCEDIAGHLVFTRTGFCPHCHDTRYVSRSWDELPEGALAGALKAALGLPDWKLVWLTKGIDLNAVEYVLEGLKEATK